MSPIALALRVQRITPALGARVEGIDISDELDEATVAELRHLLLEHKLLIFPAQHLLPDSQIAFARRFGTLTARTP